MADILFFDNFGPFTLEKIIEITGTTLLEQSNLTQEFDSVASLSGATKNQISFFSNTKYLNEFTSSKAGICITQEKFAKHAPSGMIVLLSNNPYKAYALIASAFHVKTENHISKIAKSAFISKSAKIGKNCEIGENVVIEDGAIISNYSKISHNSIIGKNVRIGEYAQISSNVVITHTIIGTHTLIHPGAKIGQDGFGFASDHTGHIKVPQLGRVIIGNHVEIGANTTIDRGAGPDTIISDMTKIDNLVQIGHNVKIGKACIIVAQVGISGSTEIGDFSVIGGQAGLSGHLKIGHQVQIAAQSGVISNINPKQIVGGTPAIAVKDWHRQSIILKQMIQKRKGQFDD